MVESCQESAIAAAVEVFHDGDWHLIEPISGALTINAGDMLQVSWHPQTPARALPGVNIFYIAKLVGTAACRRLADSTCRRRGQMQCPTLSCLCSRLLKQLEQAAWLFAGTEQ